MPGRRRPLRHHGGVLPTPPGVEELRQIALAAGLDALGVARAEPFLSTRADLESRRAEGLAADMAFTYRNPERSTSPERLLRNARSLVVGARNYHRHQPPRPIAPADTTALADTTAPADTGPADTAGPVGATHPEHLGQVGRYAWEDHYAALRQGLEAVSQRLRAHGFRAAVFLDGNHLVDREAAYRAGLGWYGKNTNLLVGERGSWFVLGSVVTDADLPADEVQADGCGSCRRCLDACPTGALPRPGVLDANRCLAWLAQRPGLFPLEHRVALGARIYGCDDCQTVCPPNRRDEQRVALRTTTAPTQGAWVPLLELLAAPDEDVLQRWGHWYLAERRPFALRRNALLALGNTAQGTDPRVVAALQRHLQDPDPLLRATAVWAARRLGLAELAATAATDPDATVRQELAEAVKVR